MSEFERSWIESERHRHQRLLSELKQVFRETRSTRPRTELTELEPEHRLPQQAEIPRKRRSLGLGNRSTVQVGSTIVR